MTLQQAPPSLEQDLLSIRGAATLKPMSQPRFPQPPGWRPQPGRTSPAGRPHTWPAPEQPWSRQPGNHPRPDQRQQFPPRAWQPPPQVRPERQTSRPPRHKRSLRPLLGLLLLVLVVLVGYELLAGPDGDDVASNYENENYVVPSTRSNAPDIPVPQYESEIAAWLVNNTLYDQQLASPVRCGVEPTTVALGDNALQSRMRKYVECLTRVWGPALEAAGHIAYQPTLYVYPAGGEVTTSCGRQESLNAFYCGADQNLYLASDVLRILPSAEARAPAAYDLIVAHEYGHAMQGRSGVFAASHFASESAGAESEAREMSRRVELQADCFAGAAIDSLSESMELGEAGRASVAQISFEIGDDRLAARFNQRIEEGDHGVGENRERWAVRGLSGAPLSTCNSFVAPDSEVR